MNLFSRNRFFFLKDPNPVFEKGMAVFFGHNGERGIFQTFEGNKTAIKFSHISNHAGKFYVVNINCGLPTQTFYRNEGCQLRPDNFRLLRFVRIPLAGKSDFLATYSCNRIRNLRLCFVGINSIFFKYVFASGFFQ